MIQAHIRADDLDRAFDELEEQLSGFVRGLSVELWRSVLVKTPQFYGRMAASWTYSLGMPVYVDRSKAVSTDIRDMPQNLVDIDLASEEEFFRGRKRGDPEAINLANFASQGRELGFRLGMTVWIANGVDHGEGPYSGLMEAGGIRLRRGNRPGTPVKSTLDTFTTKYAEGFYFYDAQRLAGLRI